MTPTDWAIGIVVIVVEYLTLIAGELAPKRGSAKDNRSLEPSVLRRDDGSLMIDAKLSIAEVKNLLKLEELPPGDFLTLAGFVLSRLDRRAGRLGRMALQCRLDGRPPD